MIHKYGRAAALLLLSLCGLHREARAQENPNHFFIQPIITAVTLTSDKFPLYLAGTYERGVQDGKGAIMVQPSLVLGSSNMDDSLDVSQYSGNLHLGYRLYFRGKGRGFYGQVSGKGQFGTVSVEKPSTNQKGDATLSAFGGLVYLGYRWKHVFVDIGGGALKASGTVTTSDGDEIVIGASGPTVDANVGFGF